ncbi:MAG: class I SAM-dependent methyltransferase [Actinomycetota bacterium]|nr:class I SAM-dependent methyltransferase [Actinomycetota bacterium]
MKDQWPLQMSPMRGAQCPHEPAPAGIGDDEATFAGSTLSRVCSVCGGPEGSRIILAEKMYGSGEEFAYSMCGSCGSLQIVSVLEEMSRYYPADYYSLAGTLGSRARLRLLVRRASRVLGLRVPRLGEDLESVLRWLPRGKGRVLDVGSGAGILLRKLQALGYVCHGVDPHLSSDAMSQGIVLMRCAFEEVHGEYDMVMFNHSFEHMSDPHGVFAHARTLLGRRGILRIRVPVVPNNVWDEYGTDWPQLDPPRHLFTFSMSGLRSLASAHGLVVRSVEYDARPWSLVAARAYRDGRRLLDLSPEDLEGSSADRSSTQSANEAMYGDQVRLILSLDA